MPLAFQLFFQTVFENPVYFVSVVATVVISITLHELGHAYAAIWQGDETPRLAGRLTLNPIAHMGLTSLIVLMLAGIAWGTTPVTPSRFRSRHGDALVAAAGPTVNLVLALIGLSALGFWLRAGGEPTTESGAHLMNFLLVFGGVNVILLVLNLLPIPPLDGSTIVGSFVPAYRRLVSNPANQGALFVVFIAIFFLSDGIFRAADEATVWFLSLFVT